MHAAAGYPVSCLDIVQFGEQAGQQLGGTIMSFALTYSSSVSTDTAPHAHNILRSALSYFAVHHFTAQARSHKSRKGCHAPVTGQAIPALHQAAHKFKHSSRPLTHCTGALHLLAHIAWPTEPRLKHRTAPHAPGSTPRQRMLGSATHQGHGCALPQTLEHWYCKVLGAGSTPSQCC